MNRFSVRYLFNFKDIDIEVFLPMTDYTTQEEYTDKFNTMYLELWLWQNKILIKLDDEKIVFTDSDRIENKFVIKKLNNESLEDFYTIDSDFVEVEWSLNETFRYLNNHSNIPIHFDYMSYEFKTEVSL